MISNNKAPAKTSQTVIKPIVSNVKAKNEPEVKASPIQKKPQAQATSIQKPAPPKPQNQVQAQPMKKEAKKPQKEESKNQKTPIKKESKAPQKKDSKAPDQNNQQKVEQFEKLPPKFEFKRTINLKAIQDSIDSDKGDDKSSIILDETGTAFSFMKYAGVLLDVSSYLVREALGQVQKENCVEEARKTFVSALRSGGTLVFFVDLIYTNLGDYFKEAKFFSDQESIFTYSKLLKEEFYKKQILKPEEDVDYLGNKGFFLAKKEFKICVLCNVTKGSQYNPQEIIQKLGFDQFKNCFNTTLIVET